MPSKPIRDSKRKSILEKAIRGHAMSAEQVMITEYLKLRFQTILNQWMAGTELVDPERLRGEAACLKNLIQILSNAQFELLEGDTNDRTN